MGSRPTAEVRERKRWPDRGNGTKHGGGKTVVLTSLSGKDIVGTALKKEEKKTINIQARPTRGPGTL